MIDSGWIAAFPAAVTVCDAAGIILYMNQAAERLLAKHGGRTLVGSNLYDCHPPQAQEKIRALIREGKSNTYTVEKAGVCRLIHQSPWFQRGEVAGLVEISFEIPADLPRFQRN
jgi:transcriptional regulator with PAS, ATPase and Fis domain